MRIVNNFDSGLFSSFFEAAATANGGKRKVKIQIRERKFNSSWLDVVEKLAWKSSNFHFEIPNIFFRFFLLPPSPLLPPCYKFSCACYKRFFFDALSRRLSRAPFGRLRPFRSRRVRCRLSELRSSPSPCPRSAGHRRTQFASWWFVP